jgi:hypothetical protein
MTRGVKRTTDIAPLKETKETHRESIAEYRSEYSGKHKESIKKEYWRTYYKANK